MQIEIAGKPAKVMHLHDQRLLSISVDDKFGGNCMLGPYGSGWWIYMLWVSPPLRRQGVARKLMDLVIAEYGVFPLYLSCRVFDSGGLTDEGLRRFYESFGFVAVQGAQESLMQRPPD